jgi:endo-alpha-1,4-polygalactosaminidase (GH114 family)
MKDVIDRFKRWRAERERKKRERKEKIRKFYEEVRAASLVVIRNNPLTIILDYKCLLNTIHKKGYRVISFCSEGYLDEGKIIAEEELEKQYPGIRFKKETYEDRDGIISAVRMTAISSAT